jgi:tricorn protease
MRTATKRIAALAICLWIGTLTTNLSAQQKIRLASSPALSPDGKRLAFSWRGDIWTVGSGGGAAKPLTSNGGRDTSPAFSPDGKSIAFNSDRNGARHAYVVRTNGGSPKQLTFHSEGCHVEQWYPDGTSLLVSANRDHYWRRPERFFRISTEQRSAEQLLFDGYGRSGSLSPDGKRLLFTREGTQWYRKGYHGSQASQIWLYEVESKKFKKLADDPTGARYPLWAPDGKGFYYVSGESGAFNLWYRTTQGGGKKQLTHFEDDSVVMPCIARDSGTIVFRHLFDLYRFQPEKDKAPKRLNITVRADMVAETIQRRRLTKADEVAFSDDGLEIAMISGGDLWVMDTTLREPRQVTSTPEEERDPVFAPDGKSILFASDAEGQSDLWKVERTNDSKYWWQNDQFKLTRLTNDFEVEEGLHVSPTGKDVAFVRGRGDLWLIGADGKDERRLLESWSRPDFDWSPDGKWLVYARSDDQFNRDVWIWPVDDSRKPFNLSRHPDNDYGPVWSPDGKAIAFTGRRTGTETDIYFVYLTKEQDETTSRDRKLSEAVEKIEKVRGKQSAKPTVKTPAEKPEDKKPAEKKEDDKQPAKEDEKPEKKEETKPADSSKEKKLPEVQVDFDAIHDRIRRVSISDASEYRLLWSHDSKKLAFKAKINGKEGTYTISPPSDLSPKLLSTKTGYNSRWIARGNQILWRVDDVPASLTADGKSATFSFSAYQELDLPGRFQAAFDLCWRTMRDWYYDEAVNNRNWDQIRRKYTDVAREAVDGDGLDEVVNLMLGELNGSHLGFTPKSSGSSNSNGDWNKTTPHFGLHFASDHKGPGLKVRDVIPRSPADKAKSRILAGEIVMEIDGQAIDPAIDLTELINGRLERDVQLKVRNAEGKDRTVMLRPVSYGSIRSLLYQSWIKQNREAVAKASDGKLGYLHIQAMNMSSFYRFEHDLYDAAAGKDGLVIDVRENGGGNTADHLLTALTQPVHAITVPRGGTPGYPQDRRVYATWNKPIVVLCNQNSFSNAEIFSHAIKNLGRGKLVGVPTAGAVISTGATSIMDVGTLRLPFRGWFVQKTGQDMELNGAQPHVVLWPNPCEMPQGIDRQLDKAVALLRADVEKYNKRPQPKLQKASQRAE